MRKTIFHQKPSIVESGLDLVARIQEFALFWQPQHDSEGVEVLRQQFNFSPPATTLEREDYWVSLSNVWGIGIWIKPDISGQARASLTQISMK